MAPAPGGNGSHPTTIGPRLRLTLYESSHRGVQDGSTLASQLDVHRTHAVVDHGSRSATNCLQLGHQRVVAEGLCLPNHLGQWFLTNSGLSKRRGLVCTMGARCGPC